MGTRSRSTDRLLEELSDKELREHVKRANGELDKLLASDVREAVRAGKADENIERGDDLLASVEQAELLLREREHEALPGRLRLARQLRDSARKEPPAARWCAKPEGSATPNWLARRSSPRGSPKRTRPRWSTS